MFQSVPSFSRYQDLYSEGSHPRYLRSLHDGSDGLCEPFYLCRNEHTKQVQAAVRHSVAKCRNSAASHYFMNTALRWRIDVAASCSAAISR